MKPERYARRAICLTGALFALGLTAGSAGAMDYTFYDAHRDDPATQSYILGVGNGIGWANALMAGSEGALFCAPDTVKLDLERYYFLIDSYVEFSPEAKEVPVEAALARALQAMFPCQ